MRITAFSLSSYSPASKKQSPVAAQNFFPQVSEPVRMECEVCGALPQMHLVPTWFLFSVTFFYYYQSSNFHKVTGQTASNILLGFAVLPELISYFVFVFPSIAWLCCECTECIINFQEYQPTYCFYFLCHDLRGLSSE